MYKAIYILRNIFIFFMIAVITACAPAKKKSGTQNRSKSSHINASQLGRNKYYFSAGYQKKLGTSYKKKK
jgi:hypothetical protein